MKKFASVLIALAACGGSNPTTTTTTTSDQTSVGKAQRFKIGSFDAWSIEDGAIEGPNDAKTLGVGQSPDEVGKLLAANGLPTDKVSLGIQVLLVKANGKVDLFDTGAADASFAKAGHLQASLAKVGVKAADVTDIFISHAHPDHTYGLVANGALAFPNAAIHMSKPEWDFMATMAGMDPGTKAIIPVITPKVVAFEPGAQVTPEVLAVATPGHTPGHSSYQIASSQEKLFYIGDVMHHSVVNVQKPEWDDAFDTDHAGANSTRKLLLESLASTKLHVFGVHFPYPGLGHISRDGDHFVYKAD